MVARRYDAWVLFRIIDSKGRRDIEESDSLFFFPKLNECLEQNSSMVECAFSHPRGKILLFYVTRRALNYFEVDNEIYLHLYSALWSLQSARFHMMMLLGGVTMIIGCIRGSISMVIVCMITRFAANSIKYLLSWYILSGRFKILKPLTLKGYLFRAEASVLTLNTTAGEELSWQRILHNNVRDHIYSCNRKLQSYFSKPLRQLHAYVFNQLFTKGSLWSHPKVENEELLR